MLEYYNRICAFIECQPNNQVTKGFWVQCCNKTYKPIECCMTAACSIVVNLTSIFQALCLSLSHSASSGFLRHSPFSHCSSFFSVQSADVHVRTHTLHNIQFWIYICAIAITDRPKICNPSKSKTCPSCKTKRNRKMENQEINSRYKIKWTQAADSVRVCVIVMPLKNNIQTAKYRYISMQIVNFFIWCFENFCDNQDELSLV